jgi:DNA repair protein RadA
MDGPAERATGIRTMSLKEAIDLAKRRGTFSSGSKGIDGLLGGGYRVGELVEVFGASGSGKTQLAMQATLSVTTAGHTCAYVDTEGTFRPERLSAMARRRGLDSDLLLSRIYHIRAEDTDRQVESAAAIMRGPKFEDCRMVVVDTLTKNFTLEYGGSQWAAKRQTLLGAYLNELARDAYLRGRVVLLANRVASIGMQGTSREVDIGGETLRHFVQKTIHLKRLEDGRLYASLVGTDGEGPRVGLEITEKGIE